MLLGITQLVFFKKYRELGLNASSSFSGKVFHKCLDTLCEDNRTNNRDNATSPKTTTAATVTSKRVTSVRELLNLRLKEYQILNGCIKIDLSSILLQCVEKRAP